jgi:anti-sigma-K factor RskA
VDGHDVPRWLVGLLALAAIVVVLSLALLRFDAEQGAAPFVVVVTPTTYGPPPG